MNLLSRSKQLNTHPTGARFGQFVHIGSISKPSSVSASLLPCSAALLSESDGAISVLALVPFIDRGQKSPDRYSSSLAIG
jgi:hypothetical protein